MANVYLTCHVGLKKQIKLLQQNETFQMANQHAHRQSSGERILIRKTINIPLFIEIRAPWFNLLC